MSKADNRRMTFRSERLSLLVVLLSSMQYLEKHGGAGRALSNQLLRSGTSVGANLEEANAGQSKADFISKCNIALKEARETHYWLRLLTANEIVTSEQVTPLTAEANELVAILTVIVKKSRMENLK